MAIRVPRVFTYAARILLRSAVLSSFYTAADGEITFSHWRRILRWRIEQCKRR